jgi:hypothetical protein
VSRAISTTDLFVPHLGESLDFSAVTSSSLPGQEAKGAMARRFVLDDRRLTSVVSQGKTGFYRPYDG